MQLRWPYTESPGSGAWGTPSSNANFCEEDYIITPYIAEFVNTLTNLTYVIYGAHGLRRVQPRKDGGLFSTLAFPYWGLISVGVLSAWFHATLKYHSQMDFLSLVIFHTFIFESTLLQLKSDDLSMFLAVGALLHQLLMFGATSSQRIQYTLLLLGTIIPVSIYHCWADEVVVHEIAFGIMVFLCGRRIRKLIRTRIKNAESKRRLGRMATFGMVSGLFGYFLWNIDYHFCNHVTRFRHSLGLPWGMFYELHGWWHILTGIGAYTGMALVEYLVTIEEGKTDRIEEGFVWPVKAVLRDLEHVERDAERKKMR